MSEMRRPLPAIGWCTAMVIFGITLMSGTVRVARAQVFGREVRPVVTTEAQSVNQQKTRSGQTLSNRSGPPQPQVQAILREGSFIGPVRGRFALHGQRWSFSIDESDRSGEHAHSTWIQGSPTREIRSDQDRSLGQDSRLGRPRVPASGQANMQPDMGSPQSARPGQAAIPAVLPVLSSMLVNENRMLERIVRAIEEDPQDDYWTITGTVTEFQDENRLLVLTANRTRRARQPSF